MDSGVEGSPRTTMWSISGPAGEKPAVGQLRHRRRSRRQVEVARDDERLALGGQLLPEADGAPQLRLGKTAVAEMRQRGGGADERSCPTAVVMRSA